MNESVPVVKTHDNKKPLPFNHSFSDLKTETISVTLQPMRWFYAVGGQHIQSCYQYVKVINKRAWGIEWVLLRKRLSWRISHEESYSKLLNLVP